MHVCMYVYACMYIYKYIQIDVFIYIHMDVCTYICMCVYVYMHTHIFARSSFDFFFVDDCDRKIIWRLKACAHAVAECQLKKVAKEWREKK